MSKGAIFGLGVSWVLLVTTVGGRLWSVAAWIGGAMLIIATTEIVSQVKKAATGGGQ